MSEEEIWKDVKGYEGLYQCSSAGRVRSLDRTVYVEKGSGFNRRLKGSIRKIHDRLGYNVVSLCKEGKKESHYVHRLVAEAFVPNPNNYPMVNHKDESRDNNEAKNLEWCTHQYNLNYGTSSKRKNKKLSTPVVGIHVESGKKITFPSMMEAGRNGFYQSEISLCCNGKKDQHKNYKWNFKTERGD